MNPKEEPNATLLPTPLEARILVSEILIILQERLDREITAQETTRQMEEAVTRSLERHAATLKAERDEARERVFDYCPECIQGSMPMFDGEGNEIGEQPCPRCGGEGRLEYPQLVSDLATLKARCEELEAAIDALSLRCGFPIVEDRKQLLETVGNKVERLEADRERLQAANRLIDRALAGVDPKWIADAGN